LFAPRWPSNEYADRVRSVLILGGSGFVGSRVVELWRSELEVLAPSHAQLDVLDWPALERFVASTRAEAVLNLAAWAFVDAAEAQQGDRAGLVYQLNAELPGVLADLCRRHGKHLIHVSTDYVFDGTNDTRPYREGDPTRSLCWYAETKLLGERAALQANDAVGVARIEMPFSSRSHQKSDFSRSFLGRLRSSQPIQAVFDQRITPIFLDHAVEALGHLLRQRVAGLVHLASTDSTTPYDLALAIARRLRLDEGLVAPTSFETFASSRPARRPQHSWLDVSLFESRVTTGVLRSTGVQLDAWAAQLFAPAGRV
jgi:dTDP-4-dehydrorhamnose reductase